MSSHPGRLAHSKRIYATLACIVLPLHAFASSPGPPELSLPHRDVIEGPFTLTAGAGSAWAHATRIFTEKSYNVDAATPGSVGLRLRFVGIDLSQLKLRFFPDVDDPADWHFNRWMGGVQLGACTANNKSPPPPRENVALGPHLESSAGMSIYAIPAPNQGGSPWWSPGPPGSPWDEAKPYSTGYDVRATQGGVVNYAGKGLYVFPGAPATDPNEGHIVFTGEYDEYASNHWYRKDSLRPHTEWTGKKPTPQQIRGVNTFDVVIDYTPIITRGREHFKRYKLEWWYRKHQSSAKLEGGPATWAPDKNDLHGGWIQPKSRYWFFGGRIADGTLTGRDEPGFDFSAVFPYFSAFGWWRADQPAQTAILERIVIEYVAVSPKN